jgi:Family of unknown function (DUF6365)
VKLLFLALSQRGYGETVIGLSLARQLAPLGVQSHFVVESAAEQVVARGGFPYSVLDVAAGPLARLVLDEVVANVRPDAIVLADYLIYFRTMYTEFRLNPWFIDRYRLPIIPIDIWQVAGRDTAADFGGEQEPITDPRIHELPACLQPVPIASPLAGQGTPEQASRRFPYRLTESDGRVSRRTRDHIRTTFDLPRDHRLVLITVAGWQSSLDARYDARFHRIADRVPLLLAHYLRALPPRTHFLLVGDVPAALRALPADRTVVLPSCSPRRFGVLLGAADLVISLNAASTTVAEAIMADVPALVIANQFAVQATDNGQATGDGGSLKVSPAVRSWLADTVPLYPFRVWPLGYHGFLGPVLAGNPYADALALTELLDEEGTVTEAEAILYDKATQDAYARARADYHQTVTALPDTCETFTRAARAAGLTMR